MSSKLVWADRLPIAKEARYLLIAFVGVCVLIFLQYQFIEWVSVPLSSLSEHPSAGSIFARVPFSRLVTIPSIYLPSVMFFLAILCTPGMLLGALPGSWQSALRSFLLLLGFYVLAAVGLMIYDYSLQLDQSSGLKDFLDLTLTTTKIQLLELASLSPYISEPQNTWPFYARPLLLALTLLHLVLIGFIIHPYIKRRNTHPRLTTIACMVIMLLVLTLETSIHTPDLLGIRPATSLALGTLSIDIPGSVRLPHLLNWPLLLILVLFIANLRELSSRLYRKKSRVV